MNQKTIAPHVASAIAFLGAILSALHPGFTLNASLSQWASVTLLVVGGVIQTITTFFHANNAGKLELLKTVAEKVLADYKAGTIKVSSPNAPTTEVSPPSA